MPLSTTKFRALQRFAAALLLGLAALTACAQAASSGAAASTATNPPTLSGRVQHIVSQARLGEATVACHIVDLETRQPLAQVNSDRSMIPASNMKILTSGAALLVLGEDFHFDTRVRYDEAAQRLAIVGAGDPGLADPALLDAMEMNVEGLVDLWAGDVAAAGIDRVAELVVDDRIFDEVFVHPTWEAGDLEKAYGAGVSGFNFFGNCLAFYTWPSRQAGAAPNYRVEPDVSRWFEFKNQARTVSGQQARNEVYVARQPGTNSFTLRGTVKQSLAVPILVTVHDPAAFHARLFAERLKTKGVEVGVARSAATTDPWPLPGEAVGRPIRTTIQTVLARCNQDSENLYAETLLKRIGHEVTGQPGSWANGAAVERMLLSKYLGPEMATAVSIADGSGLSRENRVTARVLASWLGFLHGHETLGDDFVASLAEAGVNGTLRQRFDDMKIAGTIRAKSGYINGVSCLSGYVLADSGRAVAFSILCNDVPRANISQAKVMQERVVKAIDEYLVDVAPALASEPDHAESGEPAKLGG